MITGHGMWIWQADTCEGGDVAAIVDRARAARLSHVLVKIADGRSPYNGTLLTPLTEALQQAGVDVWAWHYTYGSNPSAEARYVADRYRDRGFAGLVVDAETEYKSQPYRARVYMRTLREQLPDATVALSSYWSPYYHPTFPWQEFLERCDLGMPQVYWYNRDPVATLGASLAQWGRYGVPLVPTGAAYPQAANPGDIQRFAAAVRERGLACNYWDWQHCTEAMWDTIARSQAVEEDTMATTRDVERIAREICRLFAAGERGDYYVGDVLFELTDEAACSEFVRECCEAAAETQDHGPLSARYFGDDARHTERKLIARGTRIAGPKAVPGDIVAFNRNTESRWGHIGIHLSEEEYAENTSSTGRGPGFVISRYDQIGRHRISGFYHLPEFDRAHAPGPPKVNLGTRATPNIIECNARIEDGVMRADVRPLLQGVGFPVRWRRDLNKAFVEVTAEGMLGLIEWMEDDELHKLQRELDAREDEDDAHDTAAHT